MSLLLALPLVMSPAVYFAGRLFRPAAARVLALGTILALALLCALVMTGAQPSEIDIGALAFRIDALGLLFVVMLLAVVLLVLIFSGAEIAGQVGEEKYYALLLTLTGGLIGVACATDLFNLWLWFELMVASTYFLVVFKREEHQALEAGVKYLVQTTLGTALVLFGVALALAQTGSLNIDRLGDAGVAGVLLLIGFGSKLALVPLHTWLPDAYSQSPDAISVLQAAVVTQSGLIALLRALTPDAALPGLLLLFGAVNMLAGNLLALPQRDLKRMLAYSSLTHIGFILFGIGIGLSTGTPDGIRAGLFHLLNHGMMKGLAFFAVGALFYALRRQRGIDRALRLDDLPGTAQQYPLAALALAVALLSLAGVPPLAGFMSKWQIFAAGMEAGSSMITLLTIFAALCSVFSLSYYLPVINALFRTPPVVSALAALPLSIQFPLIGLSAALIVVGLLPDAVTWLTQPASLTLILSLSSR